MIGEQGDRRAAAVPLHNAELATEDRHDVVRKVDLHLAAFGQRLDRMVDYSSQLQASISELCNGYLELGVVAADEIDMGFDFAIVRDPVGRGFDLWVGRKGDPEGIVGVAVFPPVLRDGGTGENEQCADEDERSHSCTLYGCPKGFRHRDGPITRPTCARL